MDLEELAKQYGGVSTKVEPVNLEKLAKELGGTSRPVKERTVGEAFTDPAAKFASGIGQLIQFPGQIYGLTTGAIKDKDFGTTGLQGLGQNLQDYAKKKLSEQYLSEEAETARKVEEAEKKGQLAAFGTQVGEVLKNPLTQGIGFAAEQIPQAIPSVIAALIPGAGPALAAELRAAQVAAKAAVGNVAKKEAADAALKLAENAALKSQISRGTKAAIGTGAAQQGADIGSGSFEEIKQYLMTEKGLTEDQAAAQALNLARAAGASGAAISLLAQKLPGAQALERALAGERLGTGRIKGAIAGAIKNIPEEMVEEGGGKVTQNLALRDVNPEQSLTAGLGQTLGQAALGAGLIGGGAGAISGGKPTINPEDVKNAEFEKRKAEDIQRATEKRAEIAAQMEVVKNPVGVLTEADLGPELSAYVNEHRTATGKPTLSAYSLDDVVDALPGKDKAKEAGALNALIAQKTGYTAEVYTPDAVTALAEQKNVNVNAPGFGDFLSRTTGINDLAQMSQPQLHSAVTALQKLPTFETKQELPEGTNATRYSPEQLTKAIDGLNAKLDEVGKDELSFKETTKVVETATGLKGSAVNALLNDATKSGSIVTEGNKVSVPSRSTPSGYDIQEEVGVEEEQAESYDVMSGDQKVRSMDTQEKAEAHAEKLNSFAQAELKKTQEGLKAQDQKIAKSENELHKFELNGLVDTPAYKVAEQAHQAVLDEAMPVIADLKNQEEIYSRPVTVVPVGVKKVTPKTYRVTKGETVKGTKATREEAEQSIFEDLSDKEIQELAKTKSPKLKARVNAEIERRSTAPAPQPRTPEQAQKLQAAQATLQSMLGRFGLQDVALKIVDAIEQGAEGSYAAKVIQLAIDASQPVRVMRHEALHALKELGFFTDSQWASLQRQANAEWINKYLKGNQTRLPDGRIVSRYDAYIEVNQTMPAEWNKNNPDQPPRAVMSDAEIKELLEEEAIADAFGDFDVEKAPPGMLNALLNKLRNFFSTLKSYLNGQGYESYKDIFGKIEKGELKPSKPAEANKEVKKSLTSFGAFYGDEKQPVYTPLSTRNFMEQDMTASQQDLGLNTKAKRGIFNNVRDIASALNQYTIDRFGQMDRSNLSEEQSTQLAKAMADEVAFQLGTQATTGTGLGWYSNNYPKAVKRLASRFPELSDNKHARSVFSALVAVTSNGEKVNKNIDNAITLYAKLRDGKPLIAMGNRRATALENNLKMIQDLLNQHGTKFEKVLLEEITVKEMNARLREMGEDTDGSYLKDTTVPAAAVYFGPKLGAFYANLSGSEGYLTMDLWWTRSVNRMRGLLIPQATEASINKFRDMMEMPSATRDEVIAATIPLRNKYEEYGYSTELEYLAKGKEPAKKDKKPAWFKKAKAKAGAAYDQLLFEHNLEKMANTIYKNEFEMLEEAPFTATDRKFMYDAGRKAQTMLRKDGINLTLADIQAALWYYEKRLYEKLSGRKADDIGYEEAIIAQSGKTTGRARPSVVFDTELNRRDESGGAVKDTEELRGKSDYGPKYSLREAVRSYRGRNESEPETHTRRSIEDSEGIRVLGVKPIAEYKPTQGFKDIISDHGYESPVFYEISNEDAETYSDAIQASKNASPYGAAVYIYPLEDYAKMRLFTTKDGKAGFALKNDDIVSVFSSPPHKGSTYSSLQIAVQEGGRRLDAFDTVLPEIYHANGFKSVGRMRWNEDYIPDGWNKQTFTTFNNGEPDVVYMSYDPDDSTTLTQSPGEYYDDPDELVAAQARAVKNYFEEGEGYGSRKQNQRTGKLKASAQELPDQRRVRRDIQLLDDETRAKYPYLEEPVEGLPAKVKVDGVEVTFGPYIPAREAAILYAEKMGIPYRQQASYHKLDKKFSTLLANTYARMLNRPLAADVKEAYDAWAKETIAQYEAMIKTGITIEFMPNNRDPYGNPRNAILDVINNNHLYVFPADGGFGKDAITEKQIRTNPALALTDIIISGRQARVVEVFRATHDFYGHVKEGFGFRAEGEENAFQSHVRMYSPLAARAMTAGTRGQNSDVNFGPNAEFNKTASGEDTIYADQKIGLMPEWATDSNIEPDATSKPKLSLRTSYPNAYDAEDAAYEKAPPTTSAFKRWFGNSIVKEEGRPLVMYHASPVDFFAFRENKPIFISPSASDAEYFGRRFLNDNRRDNDNVKVYPLWVRAERPFDFENPEHVESLFNVIKDNFASVSRPAAKRLISEGQFKLIEENIDAIKKLGFDSFYVKENDTKNLAVFDANQVKSVTGNSGEFGETKDMRFSLRNVDTPEFKRFFGDSKVVNADGTPRVVYHGTTKDFDVPKTSFKREEYAKFGFHVGTEEAANTRLVQTDGLEAQGANIMPVYVRAENPLRMDENRLGRWGIDDIMSAVMEKAERGEIDGISPDVIDDFFNDRFDIEAEVGVENNLAEPRVWQDDGMWMPGERSSYLKAFLQQLGYDSIVYNNEFEGGGDSYILLDAKQVKSATGNIGTYDPTNPDIRYSLRDEKFKQTQEAQRYGIGINTKESPEMIGVRFKYGGQMQMLMEHIGDLVHRAAMPSDENKAGSGIGPGGREYGLSAMREKVGRAIRQLTVNWGTEAPFTQINRNAKYFVEDKADAKQVFNKEFDSVDDFMFDALGKMQEYATAYERIPVHTELQKLSREAAVAVGRNRLDRALTKLQDIDKLINSKDAEANYEDLLEVSDQPLGTKRVQPKLSFPSIADQIAQTKNGTDINDSILGTTTVRQEDGFIERMMSAISPESFSRFRASAINRYNQMSVNDKKIAQAMGGIELLADASAEFAALQSDTSAGVAAAVMGYGESKGGVPVYEKGYTTVSDLNGTVKGLTELLMPLAVRGDPYIYRAFQFYSGVKRGTRLDAEGKEKLFDKKDIQFAKDLELLYPEFKQVHADWIKYNNGHVDYMVKTGVLTPEKGKIFKKYADYIPFYRQLEGEETFGPNIFQSLANVKPPKKIKGGEAPLADFLETVVRNTQASVQSGMKNIAATRAIDQALILNTASQLPEISSAPNTVTILRNGIPVSYAVSDRLLLDAMQSLNLPEMPFLGILAGPANLLRNLVTKDPGFMLANMMRDSLAAYATSGADITPMVDTIRNFGRVMANRSPEFYALMNAGAIGGYDFSKDVATSGSELAKDLRKKSKTQTDTEKALRPITSLWGFLEKSTEASDAATRIAVYKDVLARTGNEAEAIRQAIEVMNFNRKGSSPIIRIVTAAIPFLNARIQGLDVLYRAGMAPRPKGVSKTDYQRRVQKNFLIRGATMMALSSMYWFMMKDDDEYKKQEQEVRDNNWILPMIGARIPIPFEVGVLFKVLPERFLAFAFGGDTGEDLANSMERALRSTFGVNYLPQTILPLVEARTNYSYFTMRPIVSQGLEGVRPGLQVGPNTTQIAQTVGNALNVSPIKIDHVIQGYTGTMGMYLVSAIDAIFDSMSDVQKPSLRPDQYPIVKRFAINKEAKGTLSAYFELKDAVDETVRTVNILKSTGQGDELSSYLEGKHRMFGLQTASLLGARGFITNMDAKMKPLLESAKKIRASDMSPDEKRDALSDINQALISITSDIQEIKKGLSE